MGKVAKVSKLQVPKGQRRVRSKDPNTHLQLLRKVLSQVAELEKAIRELTAVYGGYAEDFYKSQQTAFSERLVTGLKDKSIKKADVQRIQKILQYYCVNPDKRDKAPLSVTNIDAFEERMGGFVK